MNDTRRQEAYSRNYSVIALHLVSEHGFTANELVKPLEEVVEDHRYEHQGPGTIRNHDPHETSWSVAMVAKSIREHDHHFTELPAEVAAIEREIDTPDPAAQPAFLPPGMYTGSNGSAVAVGDDQRMLVVGAYPPTVGGVRITDPQALADLAAAIGSLAEGQSKATGTIIRAADPTTAAVRDILDRVRRLNSRGDPLVTDVLTEIHKVIETRGIVL